MIKLFAFLLAFPLFAHAENPSVEWPARNSKVICGGIVDGDDLEMKVVVANELLKAESKNERVLLYVDLHKAGQVRLVMVDALNDAELAKLDAILAKLSPEDASLMSAFRSSHVTDFYMGMTDSFVHLTSAFGKRSFSFSCQEIANPAK
jgi:hypothetical protein